jgi:membrane associated rhomboid family serine protease
MFAVWMFGPVIENEWGERRFLIYYLICGLGAAFIQEIVWSAMISNMAAQYSTASVAQYASMINTIGASGAVFGILFAFGWLYPDVPMFLLFIPIPIRARTFVIVYALIELFAGVGSMTGLNADHVAHFAHLGGMLFGWLLLLYWRKTDWREPRLREVWNKLKDGWYRLWHRHPRLDSKKGKDFDNYHYQKRV